LLELLVVVAILGILAGVAVFAVGGLSGESQEVACDADARVLATAQGAYAVEAGRPGSEAELVQSGFLAGESESHDVLVGTDTYDLVPVGGCAAADASSELRSGLRVGGADDRDPLDLEPDGGEGAPQSVCRLLGPDTGDANQNPTRCDDEARNQPPGGDITTGNRPRHGRTPVGPSDDACGPNQRCDTDMAPELELRR
jgi:type II secretory pathway pseudopilin PulG